MPFRTKYFMDDTGSVKSLDDRDAKYIQKRIEGKSEAQAIKQAGVSPKRVFNKKQDGTIQAYFRELMAAAGIGDEVTIKCLMDGIQAEKHLQRTKETIKVVGGKPQRTKTVDYTCVPDHQVRLAFLRTKLELEGSIGSASEEGASSPREGFTPIPKEDLKTEGEGVLDDMVARARAIREGRAYTKNVTKESDELTALAKEGKDAAE